MKFLARLSILVLGISALNTSFAADEEITNLRITADNDYLNILWDGASSSVLSSTDGYALQWSDRETDVRIDKPANLYEKQTEGKSLRRGTFTNNTWYYTRIYTYTSEGRFSKELGNGSKVLKWKINYLNEVESSEIDAKDPVIVKTTSTGSGSSNAEFGTLRVSRYDTFADLGWSKPKGMTSGDYDGFMIQVSKNSDMKDPIAELSTDRQKWALRITDLTPSTQYYVQGHFYEEKGGEKVTFGESDIKSVKTIAAIPRDGKTSRSRNLLKIEKRGIYKLSAEDGSSSSSSSSTTTTTTTTKVDESDDTAVRNRIAEIKRQIRNLQAEMNRLEDKIGVTKTTVSTSTRSTSTKSTRTSSSSSSGKSIRERLKEILAKKRAAKNQ